MKKICFVTCILALSLLFGLTMISCNRSGGGSAKGDVLNNTSWETNYADMFGADVTRTYHFGDGKYNENTATFGGALSSIQIGGRTNRTTSGIYKVSGNEVTFTPDPPSNSSPENLLEFGEALMDMADERDTSRDFTGTITGNSMRIGNRIFVRQ